MFDFATSPFEIPGEFADVCRRTWGQISGVGTWWNGTERVAIASAARAARRRDAPESEGLPEAAVEVATMVGGSPAQTSHAWEDGMVADLGEERYVEVASVASRVVAVDTFTRLVGCQPEGLPASATGEPPRVAASGRSRGSPAWVSIIGFALPRNSFSIVPAEVVAMVDLTDTLYMPEHDMVFPNYSRMGLHRTHMETVAGVTSHANQCFY